MREGLGQINPMASLEELQEELVRQSSRRLEVEHDRVRLEELWRTSVRQLAAAKAEHTALQEENAALAQRLSDMEDELADLSSSLVDQANQQVSEANRKAAAAHKLVEERDDVIEFQQAQLHALKEMLERNEEERSQSKRVQSVLNMARLALHSSETTPRSPMPAEPGSPANLASPGRIDSLFEPSKAETSTSGTSATARPEIITRELVLDLDAYASPLRPIMRTDLRDFTEFLAAWGSECDVHPTMFAKLETPPWRRVKFVQRAIQEDIETTLRLDRTPHLSWLSSRAFLNGVLDQTLALEPVSAKEWPWAQRPSQPCLLCGENRSDAIYARDFWARPAAEAEAIVLDLTCVVKTRLACEFVSFLRCLANRPPTSDVDAQIRAWRQCNSMREQLFWVRTGGLFPEAAEALEAVLSSAKNDFDFDPAFSLENANENDIENAENATKNASVTGERARTNVTKSGADATKPNERAHASENATECSAYTNVSSANATEFAEDYTRIAFELDKGVGGEGQEFLDAVDTLTSDSPVPTVEALTISPYQSQGQRFRNLS